MNHQNHHTKLSGAIFLIGMGLLMGMDLSWWPNSMFVLGLAVGADRAFRGDYTQAFIVFLIFSILPFLANSAFPWHIFGPFMLISWGTVTLVNVFTHHEAGR